jgi:hypothetical protein
MSQSMAVAENLVFSRRECRIGGTLVHPADLGEFLPCDDIDHSNTHQFPYQWRTYQGLGRLRHEQAGVEWKVVG